MVVFWGRGINVDEKNDQRARSAGSASTVSILLQVVNATQAVLTVSPQNFKFSLEDDLKIKQLEGEAFRGGRGGDEPTSITPWKLSRTLSALQIHYAQVDLLSNPVFWQHPVSQVFRETLCHSPEYPENVKIAIYEPLDGETENDLETIKSRDPKIVFPHRPQEEAHEVSLVELENEYVVSVEDEVLSVKKGPDTYPFFDAVAAGLGLLHWKEKLKDWCLRESDLKDTLNRYKKALGLLREIERETQDPRERDPSEIPERERSSVSGVLRKMAVTFFAIEADIFHVPKDTFIRHWNEIMPRNTTKRPASRRQRRLDDRIAVSSSIETDYSAEGSVSKRPRRSADTTAVSWFREKAEGSVPRRLRRLADTIVDSSPSKRKKRKNLWRCLWR